MPHLHTYADGDFFLAARAAIWRVRAYPEIPLPVLVDSYLTVASAAAGYTQKLFMPPACVFHQFHPQGVMPQRVAETVGTSFILQGLEFARAGGRFTTTLAADAAEVVVLAGHGTELDVVGASRDLDELVDVIVAPFLAGGVPVRAAVGLADSATVPITERIEARLAASELVVDLVRYRVGPSIAAHTGPGTAGGFWWPATR